VTIIKVRRRAGTRGGRRAVRRRPPAYYRYATLCVAAGGAGYATMSTAIAAIISET